VRQMAGKTAEFPGGCNQAIPELGMPLEELMAKHVDEMYHPGREVFRSRGV
jgi:hypothetical protein